MAHSVYSFDPGVTTGYTYCEVSETEVVITVGQGKRSHGELWTKLSSGQPDTIISESFEYRNGGSRNNVELISREFIGIFRLYAELTKTRLVMQTASQGKGYFTDDKLKAMELYPKGLDHGRDAIRHFLQWFTFGAGYLHNCNQPIRLVVE